MKIKYLIVFVSSLLLFLATSWTYTNPISASWVGSACYFVLTFLFLQSYDDGSHATALTWCVVVGRLVPEVLFKIVGYTVFFANFYIAALTVASVVMAATYYRCRQGVVLMLSVVVMILLNTSGYDVWSMVAAR